MKLSNKGRYGVRALFDIAFHNDGRPTQIRAIAERQGIPPRFLEQIFARLRRAELVEGKRGPGGGYVLRRPPEAITLREVVEAVEGPLADRLLEGTADWPASPHRPDFLWPELARRMSSLLDGIAVADLCREAARSGIARDLPAGLDYQI